MRVNLDDIYNAALRLPDESKAQLVDRLVEYLATPVDPDLERVHLDTVKRRKEEVSSGEVKPIKGKDALALARQHLII